MWKLYVKAGKPGWAAIIPFYNIYVLFEIAGMNGWMFLLLLIPIVNIVILIMLYINLAKAFGKSTTFTVGLIFLNIIFILILGFGNDRYIGVKKEA
jgi:Na+/melibiose symporter-like transporter